LVTLLHAFLAVKRSRDREQALAGSFTRCYSGAMRRTARIDPEEYVLSALSPEARLDAALRVAKAAFRGSKLTPKDVDDAVRRVRRRLRSGGSRKASGRR